MAGRPQTISPETQREIVRLWDEGASLPDLQDHCSQTGKRPSPRTIHTVLRQHNARRRHHPPITDSTFRVRVAALFLYEALKDEDILKVLKAEGWNIAHTTLVQLRKSMGLKRRLSKAEYSQRRMAFRRIIQAEVEYGHIEGLGRGLLQAHFRTLQSRSFFLSRDLLFQEVREANPQALHNRAQDFLRRRDLFTTPGNDFVWSLDAHCKLEDFGFQIYGAIDANSRYVLWTYCGPSSRTMVSVLRQYSLAIRALGRAPRLIRVDKGCETLLMANAQYQHALQTRGPDTKFKETVCFGTSTRNVRIESWWNQLSKSTLKHWRDYFHHLKNHGFFRKDQKRDRIAMKYIFTPIIRYQLAKFVETWNVHTIRSQKDRPHVKSGVPRHMYWHSDQENQGTPIDAEYVDRLIESTDEWDIDEYLPALTMKICKDILEDEGFPKGEARYNRFVHELGQWEYDVAYKRLRHRLQEIDLDSLQETIPPVGGRNWQPVPPDLEQLYRARCSTKEELDELESELDRVFAKQEPEVELKEELKSRPFFGPELPVDHATPLYNASGGETTSDWSAEQLAQQLEEEYPDGADPEWDGSIDPQLLCVPDDNEDDSL